MGGGGERLAAAPPPGPRGGGAPRRFAVTVAPDAPRSQPYFLRRPLAGALYDWTGVPADWRGLPFEPPLLELTARVVMAGAPVTLSREVVCRFRDEEIGEVRRPLFVTRAFDVAVSPDLVVWPTSGAGSGAPRFTLVGTNPGRGPARAQVVATPPAGWPRLAAESLSFQREDETRSFAVSLTLPRGVPPGAFRLGAAVRGSDGRLSDGALVVIDYPHIRPRPVEHASVAELRAARPPPPRAAPGGYRARPADPGPRAPEAVRGATAAP